MGRLTVAFAVALVVLAGCGGTPSPTDGSDTDAPTTGATTPGDAPHTATPSPGGGLAATVVRVVDGDTFEVRYRNGTTDTVRLLGVDTPEVHTATDPAEFEGVPTTDAGRAWLRDWGHRASEFARTELLDARVRLVVDPAADRHGRYGRLLAYVVDDDGTFNRRLLERGYARLYDSSFGRRDAFAAAESEARANGVGLWGFAGERTGSDAATPLPDGGTALVVAAVHADAAGNDHENRNDEYLVFENAGASLLDLSSWRVRDAAGHTYRVPDGVVLAPGDRVTLYTGGGTDTASALYWGADGAIWNNGGDTVTVVDDDGRVVLERSY
ncbi:lamin tail domain-containing protein [Haloplanus sp. GCM10025708]|uniref:lamin tail domain-containing protein n=1 Tax=Haloferacaceae TaxID=1644056 RepID=UPI003620663D